MNTTTDVPLLDPDEIRFFKPLLASRAYNASMNSRIKIPIAGMTCRRCADHVGEALRGVPGVASADVLLSEHAAVVEFDANSTNRPALAEAVAAAGYRVPDDERATRDDARPASENRPRAAPARTQRVRFAIEGMHCAACVGRVERSLMEVAGVASADVNMVLHEATVRFDAARTSLAQLESAVAGAGYRATPLDDPQSADERAARQRRQATGWKIRFFTGLALLLPLVILHLTGEPHGALARWTMLLAATTTLLVLGAPYFLGAWRRTWQRSADMDTLITLGVGAAFTAGVFDFATHRHSMYFMDGAMILVFVTLGKWLEAKAKHRTGSAIRHLLELAPLEATLVDGARLRTVRVEDVEIGTTLLIRPGAQIPLDGLVLTGTTAVDQAWLTGESLPSEKNPGDEVFAGTINGAGSLTVRATRRAEQTTLAKTIELVRHAQETKPQIQRLADRIVRVFVPGVLLVATVTAIAWLLAGDWRTGLSAAISVLVVACPCALGLAVPTAIVAAAGRGAEAGILIKEASALEVAASLTHVVFDKTGTLTEGKPRVIDLVVANASTDEREILSVAAAAQRLSSHPLARAVVEAAEERGLAIPAADRLSTIAGRGIVAHTATSEIIIGNEKLMEDRGFDVGPLRERLAAARAAGKTPLLVAVDKR
ncbi:MAG: heavy metal translocating P-type ATPase, partial [Planctomycetia bacterium]|nr:heavy metal translocating P-type ATPase [Planctomycetia bacterium]